LLVHTFLKNHDAVEPCSYRVECQGKSVGVMTDIGEPCGNVKSAVQQCHALFLETNYDEEMLWKGNYPWYLKKRIASFQGHLSNLQASDLIREYGHPGLEYLFLSHLSKENNTSELAHASFSPFQDKIQVKVTSRYDAGEVLRMECTSAKQ
jgi:phosphoribosyl 1,2-cyclic phosphodiesterase